MKKRESGLKGVEGIKLLTEEGVKRRMRGITGGGGGGGGGDDDE